MHIVISGKFSSDVAESARHCTNELRDGIEKLDLSQVPSGLESIVYFPVIVSDDLALPVKSRRSFSRKEQAEFVNVEIPHQAWMQADDLARRTLLLNGLVQAIEETSEARLTAEAKRALVEKVTSE
jgi:hypothetical protein